MDDRWFDDHHRICRPTNACGFALFGLPPMVIAHHLIFTAYGWWLPNDPRGSSSHEIRVEQIADLGELHQGRKLVQPLSSELRSFYADAEAVLRHDLLTFTDDDRNEIAAAFAETIHKRRYQCYACAIMPDHVHLLIRKHRDPAEVMMSQLQSSSKERLRFRALRRPSHPVWGGPGWKVFVDSQRQMLQTSRYIEDNPVKIWKPAQRWDFVVPYDGWAPGLT
jgi:REP element-mobilizing transposase RayT